MKTKIATLCLIAFAFFSEVIAENKVKNFDFSWKFSRGECVGAENPSFNDSKWVLVDLPHDWSISGPFSKQAPSFSRGTWLPTGKCAYRKSFEVSRSEIGKRFEILFEGAYRNSQVWINGHLLGNRPFGFISFYYDMTPYIKLGKNIVVVKLDNSSQPGSRWYTGTGIYRDVYLKISDKLYIPTWGNYIVANKVVDSTGIINLKTTINNDNKKSVKYTLRHTVFDALGKEVASSLVKDNKLQALDSQELESNLNIPNAKLWDGLKSPYLYTVKSELLDGNKIVFSTSAKVGIRTMEYSSVDGFKLNGNVVKIKGVCLHQDGGALGSGVYRHTIERQLDILKEMGANAIRLSHNPSSEEFLEVCDEKGFLVMAEIFDEWRTAKAPSIMENGVREKLPVDFYAKFFDKWSDKDLTSALMHDRSHSCIFIWSIGNEIAEMKTDAGYPIGKHLSEIVHSLDYRPTTNGVNGYGWNVWPNDKAVSTSDVKGYNYIKAKGLNIERKKTPNAMAIVTECSAVQSYYPRGVYLLGKEKEEFFKKLGYKGVTYTSLEGSKLFRQEGIEALRSVKERDYIMGQFIWTGFDYLGEVTPFGWPARSSSFAPIDLCGFPKDGYYIYQSQWSDKPMVHVFPHWNYPGHEGELIPLTIFSNCPEVELIVNGKSSGRMSIDLDGVDYKQIYTPYEPGEVKVIGYLKKSDKPIAQQIIKTAGDPAKIEIKADRNQMKSNSQDLIYIECNVLDKDGNIVPTADNMINFEISGPARIIGVDNGDNLSHEPFQANYRKAFSGKCLAIIKSTNQPGEIIFKAKSKGLQSNTIRLNACK